MLTYPVDVPNIPDSPSALSPELCLDPGCPKVASHGEIGNHGRSQDKDGELVEDALAAREPPVPDNETEV